MRVLILVFAVAVPLTLTLGIMVGYRAGLRRDRALDTRSSTCGSMTAHTRSTPNTKNGARMRIRTLLAGVGVGVLTALTLAAPASAITTPTITSWGDQCAAKGRSTVTIEVDAGQTVGLRIVDAQGEVVGRALGVVGPKTATIEITSTTEVKAQYRSGANQWGDITGATHTWSDAACRPKLTVDAPTCANPYLGVSHANPPGGSADLKVGYNGNVLGAVAPGSYLAFDKSTKDVSYTWTIASLGLTGSDTVGYVKPTGCDGDTPGSETIPQAPGEEFHGKGHHEHVVYVVEVGACSGGSCEATGGNKTASGKTLPVTGSSTNVIVAAGAIFLALGAIAMFAVARNRRRIRFQS